MRLLNVNTLTLEEFTGEPGNGVPPYSILSHRWGSEEVTFRDMTSDHAAVAHREGFLKIVRCCAKAKSECYDFVWIDTCCIDKSGSAELSEAINSMFRWYREADVCYAFLDDVCSSENPAEASSSFRRSRWFTRGWTLQELLAPSVIGTKRSLSSVISKLTKIDQRTLNDCTWDHTSIARKMSWASSRQTTRVEDEEYSLMGIFDVNMPLIYGEGQKAFYRLQLEIMKSSDDESIFAWVPNFKNGHREQPSYGLLAQSPKDFQLSNNILDCALSGRDTISYNVSKQYVQLSTPMLQLGEKIEIGGREQMQLHSRLLRPSSVDATTTYNFEEEISWDCIEVSVLSCKDEFGYIAIPLKRLDSGKFERFASHRLGWLRTSTNRPVSRRTTFVRTLRIQTSSNFNAGSPSLVIKSLPIEDSGYYISGGYPPNFIAESREVPNHSEAVARINKANRTIFPIVFFSHVSLGCPPFAIRFEGLNARGYYNYRIRVGPEIKEWEKDNRTECLEQDHVVVDANGQIPLYNDMVLFIRTRKGGSQSHARNFVNISIGPRLSWHQQTHDRSSSPEE
ncbi:HET-domain-containing protein [Stipitochalara longipes BDJ]|nr:HET-domain-containing protein [Stipitochalara longipes BDJ]